MMTMRFIDADALIAAFDAEGVETEIIEDAPTVDAVEVVRCKDCKWYAHDEDFAFCDNYTSLMDHVGDETFCSYGERRDDD